MTPAEPFELRDYQEQGVRFLGDTDRALLADEMGLGKTVQVAVALARLRADGDLRRALIVCPASLQLNWARELRRFGPPCAVRSTQDLGESDREWLYRLPVPLLITSYESLRTDFLPVAPRTDFDVVVFDEAQRLKNRDSVTTWAAHRAGGARTWLLSATPLENGVADLGSLAEVLGLLPRGGAASEDSAQVQEAFQGRFLRRRKVDVLPELPPLIVQEMPLRLSGRQRTEYDDLLHDQEWNGGVADLLALITRLKLVCNRASDGSSVKLDALRLILDDPANEPAKVIVISQYTRTLRWLAEVLEERSMLYVGDLSATARDQALRAFQEADGTAVLLLSLKAGGVGLNIPEATHVVLFDRWWTPAAEDQAVARAHRFGRAGALLVYSFRVADSVEDRIVQIAQDKTDLFDQVVEDGMVGAAEVAGWSRRDLLAVLDRA
jgi:SNF2 family DNA or RNA helicase